MSDEAFFASPDVEFAWPATERRPHRPRPQIVRSPITRPQRDELARLKHARELAVRWDMGDPDVTIADIISVLRRDR